MILNEEQAVVAFGDFDLLAQNMISMRVFTGPTEVAEMAREVMRLTQQGVKLDGSLGGEPSDPDALVAQLAEVFSKDTNAAKQFSRAVKDTLSDSQRYEAIARTVYRLGYALNDQGEVVRP